jgi:hypothetical protein
MHQTVGNVLQTLLYSNSMQNKTQTRDIVNRAWATVLHVMQITVATKLDSDSMQGTLAFN